MRLALTLIAVSIIYAVLGCASEALAQTLAVPFVALVLLSAVVTPRSDPHRDHA